MDFNGNGHWPPRYPVHNESDVHEIPTPVSPCPSHLVWPQCGPVDESSRRPSNGLNFAEIRDVLADNRNIASPVRLSKGTVILVKLDGSLYLPSRCVSALAGLTDDSILEELASFGLKVNAVRVIHTPQNATEERLLFQVLTLQRCSFISSYTTASRSNDEMKVCLIPLASAIRVLVCFTNANIEFLKQIEDLHQHISYEDGSGEHQSIYRVQKRSAGHR